MAPAPAARRWLLGLATGLLLTQLLDAALNGPGIAVMFGAPAPLPQQRIEP